MTVEDDLRIGPVEGVVSDNVGSSISLLFLY